MNPHPSYSIRRLIITVIFGVLLGAALAGVVIWRGLARGAVPAITPTHPAAALSTAPATVPAADPPILMIPAVGVYAPIIELFLDGTSWNVAGLGSSVGHLEGTARPGEVGNVALAGHVELADGQPGTFARLADLHVNDPVFLIQNGVQRRYKVIEVRVVAPDDLTVLYPTSSERLTLITCSSYDFVQNAYQKRVVVIAERVK